MSDFKNRLFPAILWLAALLVATLTPGDQLPKQPDVVGFDKLIHVGLFVILVFLWNRVGGAAKNNSKYQASILTNYLVFGIIFAILVEYLQLFIPGRSFNYWDLAANLSGGAIGTVCFYILQRKQSTLV